MRKIIGVLGVILFCSVLTVAKERSVKIQVVDSGQKQEVEHGFLHKEKLREKDTIQAIISGEHVLLACHQSNCDALAPGIYEGRVHSTEVEIRYILPLTAKTRHANFQIIGSWVAEAPKAVWTGTRFVCPDGWTVYGVESLAAQGQDSAVCTR